MNAVGLCQSKMDTNVTKSKCKRSLENIESQTTYEWSDFILVQALAEDFTLCEATGLCQEFVEQVNYAETDNTSYAVYGDIAWSFTDKLKLTVGARYTYDEKDFDLNQPVPDSVWGALTGDALIKSATAGTVSDDDSWSSFDPRVVLDYQVTDDIMLYGSVASGYKSGGFNSNPDHILAEGVPQIGGRIGPALRPLPVARLPIGIDVRDDHEAELVEPRSALRQPLQDERA